MKILLKIVGGLVALVLLLALVSFAFPRQYRVERSALIKATPEAVLAQVGDLAAWKNWGAWQERDPAMKITYSEKTMGVGAWSSWISQQEGSGKMTITDYGPDRVAYRLEFPEMGMESRGSIELRPEGGGVRIVWADAGDLGMNPMNRWVGLFLDKMIGPDFERGLSNLKKIVEK